MGNGHTSERANKLDDNVFVRALAVVPLDSSVSRWLVQDAISRYDCSDLVSFMYTCHDCLISTTTVMRLFCSPEEKHFLRYGLLAKGCKWACEPHCSALRTSCLTTSPSIEAALRTCKPPKRREDSFFRSVLRNDSRASEHWDPKRLRYNTAADRAICFNLLDRVSNARSHDEVLRGRQFLINMSMMFGRTALWRMAVLSVEINFKMHRVDRDILRTTNLQVVHDAIGRPCSDPFGGAADLLAAVLVHLCVIVGRYRRVTGVEVDMDGCAALLAERLRVSRATAEAQRELISGKCESDIVELVITDIMNVAFYC
jgi:hypothetical protein